RIRSLLDRNLLGQLGLLGPEMGLWPEMNGMVFLRLSHVVRSRRRRAAMTGPVGVEELAPGAVDPLVGVSAEEIALGLQQVGRQSLAAIAVEIGQGGGHGRNGNAVVDRRGADPPPAFLGPADRVA